MFVPVANIQILCKLGQLILVSPPAKKEEYNQLFHMHLTVFPPPMKCHSLRWFKRANYRLWLRPFLMKLLEAFTGPCPKQVHWLFLPLEKLLHVKHNIRKLVGGALIAEKHIESPGPTLLSLDHDCLWSSCIHVR